MIKGISQFGIRTAFYDGNQPTLWRCRRYFNARYGFESFLQLANVFRTRVNENATDM